MSSSASPYFIPAEPGRYSATMLALLMHAALLLFFWIGIDWRNEVPLAVEAEVWDMKIQEAAPKPVAPPEPEKEAPQPKPQPKPVEKVEEKTPEAPKVDIALEQEKKRQRKLEQEKKLEQERLEKKREQELAEKEAEKKRLEKEKLAALEAKKKQALEEKQKLAKEEAAREKLRAEEMRRITGVVAGTGGKGDAPRSTGPRGDPNYASAVIAKIKSNLSYPGAHDMADNPQAVYKIDLLPSGEVLGVKKIKSSGIPAYDLAVENAIAKSSPLPRKKDGSVDREITATFKLRD